MKTLLFVLLAASLIANVALVVLSRRSATPPAAASTSTSSGGDSIASTSPAPVPAQTPTIVATKRPEPPAGATAVAPFVWPTTTQTDQDLHRVVAGLRAAGYPAPVIRAVINQLLNERFAARSPNAGQPFWKRSGSPTPETVAAQTALSHERQAMFEALLGPDARPSAMMDGEAKERRYGTLSASYSARLDTLLGPEVAEAYRNQGPGRIFAPFRQAPRPAAPANSPGTPLVPIGK